MRFSSCIRFISASGDSSANSSAFCMLRMPSTQAAMRLMLASKKSSASSTRFSAPLRTISLAISRVSSSKRTTWSLSQRTERVTCSATFSLNSSMEEILSDTTSVGW